MAEKFTLFWGGPNDFTIGGIRYNTAEQWMMAEKARLFNDTEIEVSILRTNDPREQKGYGRQVKGFDKKKWEAIEENGKPYCWNIVYQGNYAKFSQNPGLKEVLLETAGTILVEASPYDKIWGIGLGENDEDALDRDKWRGTNWLGEVLTQLREDFIKEERDGYQQANS